MFVNDSFTPLIWPGFSPRSDDASAQAFSVFMVVILLMSVWALQALLNLLRSVGDALDDLIEQMFSTETMLHASTVLGDPSCLAQRFSDRRIRTK